MLKPAHRIDKNDARPRTPWSHSSWRGCVASFLVLVAMGTTGSDLGAAEVVSARAYAQADTLRLDVRLDSLFNARALDAIASGMTTSIAYQFRIERANRAIAARVLSLRVDHDIWEGRYRIVWEKENADTLTVTSFSDVVREAGTFHALPLSPVPTATGEYVISIRADVNPISPQQRERTRRWLNLLERGSLLELFVNLDPEGKIGDWMEAARFTLPELERVDEAPPEERE